MQHRGIEQADVIGRDDGARARGRQVFGALHFKIKKSFEKKHANVLHALLSPCPQHQNHGDQIANTQHHKQSAKPNTLRLQHASADGGDGHKCGLQNIARRNDTRFAVSWRPRLHGRKRWHDVEATGNRKAKQIDAQPRTSQRQEYLLGAGKTTDGGQ